MGIIKKYLFLFCVIFFLSLSCAGKNPGEHISLSGPWKIILDDNGAYSAPDFSDKAWKTLFLPGSVALYSLQQKRGLSGIAWVRKTFSVNNEICKNGGGLVLGRIGNADETYINGILAGTTGSFSPGFGPAWNRERLYFVPRNLLHCKGKNSIAVRIKYDIYGEVRGGIALVDREAWEEARVAELYRIIAVHVVMAAGLVLGIIFLIIFIKKPAWREYGFFVLQLVPGFFVIYESAGFIPWSSDTFFRIQLLGFMWTALVVVHLIFLHRIYGLHRKWVEAALSLLLTGAFGVTLGLAIINGLLVFLFRDLTGSILLGYIIGCPLFWGLTYLLLLRKGRPLYLYAKQFFITEP